MSLAGWVGRLVAAACVAACAHTPNLPLRPDPAPGSSTTWTFKGRDGTELLARTWRVGVESSTGDAGGSAVRGVVVIMHGLKDYSARYDGVAKLLVARGYAVYAFDLRGHGRSAGPRVAPDRWTDYVDDLDRFLTEVEKREPGKQVFLFGHSMGGAIATLTAEIHTPKVAGLILSGPALVVDAPPLQLAAAVMAGVLSPGFGALKLDNHDFSSDPANAAVMDKDELIENGPGPAKTAAGLVDGMRRIWAGTDELTMPVLAMHGTADKLTAPWGSYALVQTLRARTVGRDARFLHFDGYNHDLLHEPKGRGDKVAELMVTWIDSHVRPAIAVDPDTLFRPDWGFAAPPDHLDGAPRGWTQSVVLAAGIERVNGTSFAGELALDVGLEKPIGWYGNLEGRLGPDKEIALRPIGIAFSPSIITLGVAGGAALVRGTQFAYGGKAWFAAGGMPLVHFDAFATFERTFDRGAAGFDELRYGFALRLPSDKFYWPGARAGVGPVISAGQSCGRGAGGGGDFACAWFGLLGLELFGTD